jgi:hypothetical protein|tara:strand:- start:141 stop:332 length:192 start_codon:yes stop_codon:yes gene_type:complete
VENISGMKGCRGVIAIGEVPQVSEGGTILMAELFFDQSYRLLVIIGEETEEGLFLRVHKASVN